MLPQPTAGLESGSSPPPRKHTGQPLLKALDWWKTEGGNVAPIVAVVTRTHNRTQLLSRALLSVASQTFTDYLHLVVNDAGTPSSVEEALSSLDEDAAGRVSVILNEVSAGREAAVNPGFARARELGARYVVVADDDDTWEPTFLSTCVEWLETHPHAVGVATQCTVIYEEISGENIRELRREPLATDKTYIALEDVLKENFVPPIALVFCTEVLDKLHGWREDLPVLADWDFMLRLLLEGPVGYVLEPLANWHRRPQASGDLGNSIINEAAHHRDLHAAIRDDYLRCADPNLVLHLGLPLLIAHYQVEQDQRMLQQWQATREHLEAVHQNLAKIISLKTRPLHWLHRRSN